jgi:flavin-dependent dehydrogenase
MTNVGIGMLSSRISQKRVNLRRTFETLLREHPLLSHRFKEAVPLETAHGFGLPLGSAKRSISGSRLLLAGDAAGLIDPFTGEGIGNAIRSGRIAADHIISCFKAGDFSSSFNLQYDKAIYGKMWREFKTSSLLQRLCRSERLFNWIVRKANQRADIHDLLIDALAHVDQKRRLTRPGFYFKLLFS